MSDYTKDVEFGSVEIDPIDGEYVPVTFIVHPNLFTLPLALVDVQKQMQPFVGNKKWQYTTGDSITYHVAPSQVDSIRSNPNVQTLMSDAKTRQVAEDELAAALETAVASEPAATSSAAAPDPTIDAASAEPNKNAQLYSELQPHIAGINITNPDEPNATSLSFTLNFNLITEGQGQRQYKIRQLREAATEILSPHKVEMSRARPHPMQPNIQFIQCNVFGFDNLEQAEALKTKLRSADLFQASPDKEPAGAQR